MFPLVVAFPDGQTRQPLRLVRDEGGRATLYEVDRPTRQVVVAAEGELVEIKPGRAWRLRLDDGDELTISKAGGCGCGHPLKHFVPSRPARAHVG